MSEPFNMLIVGMTACGKTHYLLEMWEKKHKGDFTYIVLICPTFPWNETYLELKYVQDLYFFVVDCNHDDVDRILRYVVEFVKGTKSLIILDDVASALDVKSRTGELTNLEFSARHYGLSTIVITQQLTSIAKPFRENVSRLVTFYTANRKDINAIADEYLSGVGKEELSRIVESLRKNKYSRLEINLRHPYGYKVCLGV